MSRRIRHTLARAHRLLHAPLAIWTSPSYRLPLAGAESALRMEPMRACHVSTWLLDTHLALPEDIHLAQPARWEDLAAVHSDAWLSSLDRPEVQGQILGIDPRQIPVDAMVETWRTAAGGVIEAARWVAKHGGRAATLLGGFHHAFPERGGGFCGINDVAVAVVALRRGGYRRRIAILDLDAHPPDGIAACLHGEPDVQLASLSGDSAWAPLSWGVDERIPLGSGDRTYLAALDRVLARIQSFDLLFYLAGADPLANDPHGGLALSAEGLRQRDARVFQWAGSKPMMILPAGGYTPGAWRTFAGTLALAAGSRALPSAAYDPVLRRTLDISRTLDPQALHGEEDWLSAEDLASALGMGPKIPRLLGYYTRPGLEYALHRLGLLTELERMGFERPRVELQADHYPHSVRILAPVRGRDEALVEIALSHRNFDRWNTLFVDWLSLRDPRVPFSAERPRMPGQDAPGLGMMREVAHILLRVSERLDLDGLSFVPSWYHIAWFSREHWIHLDPEDRGLFAAFQAHLARLPLLEATRLLAHEGICTEDGRVLKWTPSPMVVGRTPEFKAWIARGERRARAVADAQLACMVPPTRR